MQITPGTPNIPVIAAVIKLTGITTPHISVIALRQINMHKPNILFTTIFKIHLTGHSRSLPKKHIISRPHAYVRNTPISVLKSIPYLQKIK
jgi:hypothetical protein